MISQMLLTYGAGFMWM